MLFDEANNLVPPDPEEWADDGNFSGMRQMLNSRHAREAGRSRSAQKVHEDGFGLIIGRMRRNDPLTTALSRHPPKLAVAQVPRRFFDAQVMSLGKNRHLHVLHAVWHVPFFRQGPDKLRIGGGTGSQLMIDMPDDKGIGLMAEKTG